MKSLMQCVLGAEWDRLAPVLQAHHRYGTTTDVGHMDIDYPRFMQVFLSIMRVFGVLVNRRGQRVPTLVEKSVAGERQYWDRTMTYPDGKVIHFNSTWVPAAGPQLIEFINPVLGLQMAMHVRDGSLHFHGVHYVVKLGRFLLPIPEWLALGHTSIVETAIDDARFSMDFRLTHPLLGEIFRYAGEFEVAEN